MKKNVMKRWVKALRSGKYKQGTGVLKDGDRFCCLGVLCELAVKSKIIKPVSRHDKYAGATSYLPLKVREWAGMDNVAGASRKEDVRIWLRISPFEEFNSLTEMNDASISFKKIADVIEKYYAQL